MVCFSPSNWTSSVFLRADNDLTEESPAAPAALFSTIFGVIGAVDEESAAARDDMEVDDAVNTKSLVVNSSTDVKNDDDDDNEEEEVLFSLDGAPLAED